MEAVPATVFGGALGNVLPIWIVASTDLLWDIIPDWQASCLGSWFLRRYEAVLGLQFPESVSGRWRFGATTGRESSSKTSMYCGTGNEGQLVDV